jgi:acyl transferase domain-containing protein
MGAFNCWAAGSFLSEPAHRTVAQIALNLLEGAAALTRARQLTCAGVPMPAAAFNPRPRPRLDLGGTNCVVDAACAGSLAALSMGLNELYMGQSDLVITGGVDAFNDPLMHLCFSKTPALSPTGDCRPFPEGGDGTMLGEGVGLFALRLLADAERDGNHVYAILRGLGSSSDGRARSVYAPRPEDQATAVRRASEAAGYGPETVGLMEAHGTGTPAGDAAELEGLRLAFGSAGPAGRRWCTMGSVKKP